MDCGLRMADRFEIHELLGRDGMGDIYRATDTQTGETVAVKALSPEVLERDPTLLGCLEQVLDFKSPGNKPSDAHLRDWQA